jgi:hypothetical protein
MANKHNRIKIFVASTVYTNRDLLLQICGILSTYGYQVINSDYGTLYPHLGHNNKEACLAEIKECDIFFGIINPFYSTGITHEELKEAIKLDKPRRFMVHGFVTFSRKLLEQFMYDDAGEKNRTGFTIQKTSVMDDIRVIDMYNDAIQHELPEDEKKYHWAHEYFRPDEAFRHIETLFADVDKVKNDLETIKKKL